MSMASKNGKQVVFVSYSTKDAHLVAPVCQLVRALNTIVWRDQVSIKPGSRWREEIEQALRDCDTFLVFWCCHARTSLEVRREVFFALREAKHVVPVLVDRTAMSADLCPYQAVDLASVLWWSHTLARPERVLWAFGIGSLLLGAILRAMAIG